MTTAETVDRGPGRAGRPILPLALLAILVAAAAPTAVAEGDPTAVRGLVVDRCARCHLVPGAPAPEVEGMAPPPFSEIAANPRIYTEARLRRFLQRPHWPMRGFILSPRDIDDLLAYFRALGGR